MDEIPQVRGHRKQHAAHGFNLHPSQIPTNIAQSRRRKGPLAPYAVLLAQLGRLRPFSLDDLGQSSSVL